jgi:serine/threonine protein kinase
VIVDDDAPLLAERYRVGEQLGAGGMGTVFAGRDLRLDRAVAIKLLRPELARDPALRRRFEREARSAARVSHHNAVAVYDTGEDARLRTFIVMELLSGRTLAHELAEGSMDEARLRAVADGVLAALGAAHAEGIVHRDVKPANILLADDGGVKVGDFGIATSLDAGETTTSVPLGTPAYTAPERLRGLPATARSDLYSFAVVLYEAAAGGRPFVGDGPSAVAEAVVRGEHEPLGSRAATLPQPLVDAIERALATDPGARFDGASAMRDAIRSSALASPDGAPPTQPIAVPTDTAVLPPPDRAPRAAPERRRPERVTPARPRRRFGPGRIAAVVVVVAAVLLAVAIVLLTRGDTGTDTTTPTTVAAAPAAPVPTADLPAPLARALERLDRETQP